MFDSSSSPDPLSIELLRAREKLMRATRPFLHQNRCTEQQWRVLRVLDEYGELEPRDIAQHSVIQPSSLTRILGHMEKDGLVERKKNPYDGRSVLISLSDGGSAKVTVMRPKMREIYDTYIRRFGRDRARHLTELLRAL